MDKYTLRQRVNDYLDEVIEDSTRSLFSWLHGLFIAWLVIRCMIDPYLIPDNIIILLFLAISFTAGRFFISRGSKNVGIYWLIAMILSLWVIAIRFADPTFLYFIVMISLTGGLTQGVYGILISTGMAILIQFTNPISGLNIQGFSSWNVSISMLLSSILGRQIRKIILERQTELARQLFQNRSLLEASRDNQLEMQQVQKDLILANKELANLTDKLKVATEQAESALRVKEDFVANTSHELRTPLNMIIGLSHIINNNPNLYGMRLPRKLMDDIVTIERNSQHLANFVNDILDLSRVNAGKMAITHNWTHLNDIAQQAWDMISPSFKAKGLASDLELIQDADDVFCDEMRIREVILNLLGNAIRFTEQGFIKLKLANSDYEYMVSIADSGPGIARNEFSAVFEPFRQSETTGHRSQGGTGLGLTICKRIVEMHHGKIWVTSEKNEGAVFTFTIPKRNLPSDQFQTANRWINPYMEYSLRDHPFSAPLPMSVPRYLVYEHGDTLSLFLKRHIDFCEVIREENFSQLQRDIETNYVKALLLNIPELTGEELDQLKVWVPRQTPIFQCYIPSILEYAHSIGAENYLIKPISGEYLIKVLEQQEIVIKNILLVDDEADIEQLITRVLESSGKQYQIHYSQNGLEALKRMHEEKPDIVILDLLMPEMDGYTLIHEMQKDPSLQSIPIIVLSSRDPFAYSFITDTIKITKIDGYSISEIVKSIQFFSDQQAIEP